MFCSHCGDETDIDVELCGECTAQFLENGEEHVVLVDDYIYNVGYVLNSAAIAFFIGFFLSTISLGLNAKANPQAILALRIMSGIALAFVVAIIQTIVAVIHRGMYDRKTINRILKDKEKEILTETIVCYLCLITVFIIRVALHAVTVGLFFDVILLSALCFGMYKKNMYAVVALISYIFVSAIVNILVGFSTVVMGIMIVSAWRSLVALIRYKNILKEINIHGRTILPLIEEEDSVKNEDGRVNDYTI